VPNLRRILSLSTSRALPRTDFQTRLSIFLLCGYAFVGRYFVFVGLPLSILFVFEPRILVRPMYRSLTRREPLSKFAWLLLISTMFGMAEVVRGFITGYNPLTVLEVLIFNFCPWFVLPGIWAGTYKPDFVRTAIRFFAWYHAILTPLYFIFLRHLSANADLDFGRAGSGSLVLLGLLCFEPNLRRYWFPIAVCSFDTIANQVRADWLGLAIVLVIWGVATKKIGRVFAIAGVVGLLMAIGFVADVRLPGLPGRGGEISARDTIGRAVSGIDPEFAQDYSTNAQIYAGTIYWRETWWKAIREKVFEKYSTAVFGLGYGYPINDLVPYLKGREIRSPHSIFYFNLAYGGFVGFALFSLLEASLLGLLWRTYKHTGQIFGFTMLVYFLIGSFFGNFFESPQSSIPTYLLLGMCLGPLFLKRPPTTISGDRAEIRPRKRSVTSAVQGGLRPAVPVRTGLNECVEP
jgi:hypothetical protein